MFNPAHIHQHEMMTAVHQKNITAVQQHLDTINVTWEPNEIFCYACQKGQIDIVRLLLPFSDTNMDHGQPLRLATGQGHYDIVQYILPHCDATLMRSDALQLSVLSGEAQIFELLYPHSDCVVALQDLNESGEFLEIHGAECLALRDRLAEIVAVQLQKECLLDAVGTIQKPQNPYSCKKI